ncbi:MAG: hypothetical protein ACXAEU_10865 [Candidatus Hodarchaeales archaeon]|jgi:DNA-directed RNA polymerase subunit RPC12/RpoP
MVGSKDKKKLRVIETMRTATSPIPIQSLTDIPRSKGVPKEVKRLSFVREVIQDGYVEGFISRDKETFWSTRAIQVYVNSYLNKYGRIKKIKFAKRHRLSLKRIDKIIEDEVKNHKGFWSTDGKTYYMTQSAGKKMAAFLRQKRRTNFFELTEKFKWAEKDVLKMFNNIIEEGIFKGFMDKNKEIYCNHNIRGDLEKRQSIASHMFYTYVKEALMKEGEVFYAKLSDLFDNTGVALVIDFLQELKTQGHLKFVEAKSGERIYSYKLVLSTAMRVLRSFKIIPLDFFAAHLNLEYVPAMQFLDLMIENFNLGTKKGDNLTTRPADEWISDLWVPKKIAEDFALPGGASEALQFLYRICDEESELMINQADGVRALESYEITCQMDTKTYDFPDRYFECANCVRIICANCYYTLPKHAPCPFCGNISAYIVEYPRHCKTCGVNYVTVKGLHVGESSEACRYCGAGPMDYGWIRMETKQITHEEARIISYIESIEGDGDISLLDIIDALGMPDLTTMILLEECINKKFINGKIDGLKEVLVRKEKDEGLECAMSGQVIEPGETHYKCTECGAIVSKESYSELEEVGIVMCPKCDSMEGFEKIQP